LRPEAISVTELQQLLANHPDINLLDVRTSEEFEEAHVPGAQNFPLGDIDALRLIKEKTVDQSRPVYLICHTQKRSNIAAEKFLAAGHPRPIFVTGGTAGWIAASLPTFHGPSKAS
jgi:phage shock protein E